MERIKGTLVPRPQNGVSKIKIDKIVIRKLFGCTDYTFDFTQRCSILIGPNGVGKSNAFRLINSILDEDINQLFNPEFPFEKIEFYGEGMIIDMEYEEFFPDTQQLIQDCAFEISKKYAWRGEQSSFEENKLNCTKILNNFHQEFATDEWLLFLSKLYNKKTQTSTSQSILHKYNLRLSNVFRMRKAYPQDIISDAIEKTINEFVASVIPDDFYPEPTFAFMAESGRMLNLPLSYYIIDQTKESIEMSKADESPLLGYPIFDALDRRSFQFIEDISGMDANEWTLNALGNALKQAREYPAVWALNDLIFRENSYCLLRKNVENVGIININALIGRSFYTDEYLARINKRYLEIAHDIFEKYQFPSISLHDAEDVVNKGNPELFLKYSVVEVEAKKLIDEYHNWHLAKNKYKEQYPECDLGLPPMLRNSLSSYPPGFRWVETTKWHDSIREFFLDRENLVNLRTYFSTTLASLPQFGDFSLDSIQKDFDSMYDKFYNPHDRTAGYHPERLLAKYILFKEFTFEVSDEKNMSHKILLFKKYVSKYILDKEPIITPLGIKFKKILQNGKSVDISLDMLSSGEKKLLTLLAMALLKKGSRIMIDEPEISLSILWQEKLLTDLLEQPNIESLLVATHSPYMVRNGDELNPYITYLESEV